MNRRKRDVTICLVIYAVAFVLAYAYSLLDTTYLMWADAGAEYAIFLNIARGGAWVPTDSLLYASPVTTLFPALIARVIGIAPVLFFKFYIASMVAFLPPAVYLLARSYKLPAVMAIAAVAFVLFQFQVVRSPLFARVIIALAFWCLTIVCLNSRVKSKGIIVGLLSIGLVLSHYATAFLAIFCFGFAGLSFHKRYIAAAVGITIAAFCWYYLFVPAPLHALTNLASKLYQDGIQLVTTLGYPAGVAYSWRMGAVSGFWQSLSFTGFWVGIAVVVAGICLFSKDRKLPIISLLPMLAVFAAPRLGDIYGFSRFYLFAAVTTAPLFAYGLYRIWAFNRSLAVAVISVVLAGYAASDMAQMVTIATAVYMGAGYWVGNALYSMMKPQSILTEAA